MTYEATKSTILKDARELQDQAVDRAAEAIEAMTRDAASVGKVVHRSAVDIAAEVTRKLKEAGVDTNQLVITAREHSDDIQRRIVEEIRERPLRAIGFAAFAGLAFGLLSSR